MKSNILDAKWDCASWEGNHRAQLIDGMNMSFEQKLDWLEEAADFVEQLQIGAVRLRRNNATAGSSLALRGCFAQSTQRKNENDIDTNR